MTMPHLPGVPEFSVEVAVLASTLSDLQIDVIMDSLAGRDPSVSQPTPGVVCVRMALHAPCTRDAVDLGLVLGTLVLQEAAVVAPATAPRVAWIRATDRAHMALDTAPV